MSSWKELTRHPLSGEYRDMGQQIIDQEFVERMGRAARAIYNEGYYVRCPRVYFIQEGRDGPIKIGWAVNVKKRRQELQAGNSKSLHLLGTVCGGLRQEHAFHKQFAHLRIRGEWFQATDELTYFIAKECQL